MRQKVFPAPGPATTSTGPSGASMALRCWGSGGKSTSARLEEGGELRRQRRSLPRFLVLEENEGVAPSRAELADARGPARQRLGAVALVSQPQVSEISGRDLRRRPRLGIGDAERGVASPQDGIGRLVEPRGVAEFPGAAHSLRNQAQHFLES